MMEYLKENLLLGTDRRQLEKNKLPLYLQDLVNHNLTSEEQVLDALTQGYFYESQGKLPVQISLDAEPEIIKESKSQISEESAKTLEEILTMDHLLKRSFLKIFLQIIQHKGLILPPDLVVELIQEGIKLAKKDRENIIDVIGNKGRYILKTFPIKEYQQIVKTTDTSDLTSGGMFESFAGLTAMDKVEFLEKNWETFSIHEKIKYTKYIIEHMNIKLYDFYYSLFYQEFHNIPSSKSLTRTLKRLVIHLLLRFEERQLTDQLTSKLNEYISASKGFLNKILSGQTNTFNVPIKTDEFWNGAYLNAFLGLEEKNSNIATFDYDPMFWFSSMLEIIPTKLFADVLDQNLEKTVYYLCNDEQFLTTIKGESKAVLRAALIDQALLSKDQELIQVLAAKLSDPRMDELIPYMDQSTFEKYFLKYRNVTKLDLLASRDQTENNSWSVSFSKNMISELLKICKSGKFYPNERFGTILSIFYHPQALEHLLKVSTSFINEKWFESWRNHVVLTIKRALKIRKALENIS